MPGRARAAASITPRGKARADLPNESIVSIRPVPTLTSTWQSRQLGRCVRATFSPVTRSLT